MAAFNSFASLDVNGNPSLKKASANPETPIPIGLWRLLDFSAPSNGYLLTSIILLRFRVTIFAARCKASWSKYAFPESGLTDPYLPRLDTIYFERHL